MIGECRDEIDQVRLGFHACLTTVLEQREEIRQLGPGLGMPDQEPIAQFQRANRILDRVIVERGARRRHTARQRRALAQGMALTRF